MSYTGVYNNRQKITGAETWTKEQDIFSRISSGKNWMEKSTVSVPLTSKRCAATTGSGVPELSMDTLGNAEKYRGDTMNSFHTMFGREIPDRPGFYAGLEKYHPSDEMRERVREFGNKYCSTIGNFVVLPNRYVRDTTLNFYRGTNQWRDFFDRFLVRLRNELCDCGEKDPLLEELVDANAFCFDKFRSKNGFRILKNRLFLADYCDSDGIPEERFPLNYHWKDPADAVRYFSDADQYLRMAEEIIGRRSGRMLTELKGKLQQEGAMP